MNETEIKNSENHRGRVLAMRGSVVEVRFPPPLPTRCRELRAGIREDVVREVHSLPDREPVLHRPHT